MMSAEVIAIPSPTTVFTIMNRSIDSEIPCPTASTRCPRSPGKARKMRCPNFRLPRNRNTR